MKIGVKLRSAPVPEREGPLPYSELRDLARMAEELGLDSVWIMDHVFFRWSEETTQGVWESWTTLSALAAATTRIELGTLVLCTPFRNPALLAKMAATLDEVSAGRLILGLGAGWHSPEFDALGIPFDHRVSRFEEALAIIKPLLRDGRVDFEGRYYRAPNCEITPRGPRADGPPILIGGFGPRMLRLTASYADMWNITAVQDPDVLQQRLAGLRAACEREGRDPDTLAVTAQLQVGYPDLGPLPGWMQTYLSGSDEDIAAQLAQYEDLGFSHLMFQFAPLSAAALTRLANTVDIYRGRAA